MYSQRVLDSLNLTDYEIELIEKNGFMVSERLNYYTFIHAYWDVYRKDLPVYISSDAILHALHYSFGLILKEAEKFSLAEKLDSALINMYGYTDKLDYTGNSEEYGNALNDLDIYISVARNLLQPDSSFKCVFVDNQAKMDSVLDFIAEEKPLEIKLFADTPRYLDFSQFKPRGHYIEDDYAAHYGYSLANYFKTMMWLGRTEICFNNPQNEISVGYSEKDLQRMTILSAIICEAAFESNAESYLKDIDTVLEYLIGVQDNVNLWEIKTIMDEMNISSEDLTDLQIYEEFKSQILNLKSANQRYNSQILMSDITSPDQVEPAAAFLLMGQRPVIDGFITENVVFDRVMEGNRKVLRMVPSTLDILFALGNDASTQLLEDELRQYKYSENLAGLRYLINGYDDEFWNSTSYTTWLSAINSLNPPTDRTCLPEFMQTAGWWQKTMNTQLASWSELRHDFLLYAKQPYTSSYMCSFPEAFIEPNPIFYERIAEFWKGFENIPFKPGNIDLWVEVCDTLATMSEKILLSQPFSEEEKKFINRTLNFNYPCSPGHDFVGWYPSLYYRWGVTELSSYYYNDSASTEQDKFTVADVHTIPMDEFQNEVGWVLHAGTGRINLAVITTELPNGETCSFAGPVYSYYEFISNDYERLTDQDWREMDGEPAYRPEFTNLYMANKNGESPTGNFVSLYTIPAGVEDETPMEYDTEFSVSACPNPFSNHVVFKFRLSGENANQNVEFNIFDINGRRVRTLVNQHLYANNYALVWDGMSDGGTQVLPGVYTYTVQIGDIVESGKVTMVK
jgi:hypothetical protein